MVPGDLVDGRFEIEAEVAAGGMGRVFRARDRQGGALVALKTVLSPGRAELERFLREATLLESVDHPGAVRHVAHGVATSGEPFIAMEWVEGSDLGARLERGRLAQDEALGVARQVADALGALHARGLVHRDIKPSNLMLEGGRLDRVRLVDFGVARRADDPRRLTRTGQLLGTPCYMAPEQARGARDVDARADVFALGAVLYECLVGEPPFFGDNLIEVLAKVLLEPAPSLGDSPELDALLAAMLAKDPAARLANGRAVVDRIERLGAEGAPAAASVRSAAVGSAERRVMCLVLGGDPQPEALDPLAETIQARPVDLTAVAVALRGHTAASGARIEAMIDGSLLIVVGGPGVASDHAVRAVGLSLVARTLAPSTPFAVATGLAEQSDALPVGELARRATALLERAADGRVRIDRATADLAGQRFELVPDDDAFVLLGARQERAEADARLVLGKRTRCVGRERELALLEGLFDECAQDAEARAALVIAPAGVGKSRLRRELCARIAARHPDLELMFGSGEVQAAGAAFGLVGQAIRRRAQIVSGEPPERQRDKLAALFDDRLFGAERERALTFLGEVAQIPAPESEREALRAARRDPALMSDTIRVAWSELVAARCRAGPVLIVFDDLHWGDLPSVELADAALKLHARSPLMVLGLGRPDLGEKFPRLWAQREPQIVQLSTLGRRAAEQLVRQVLGDRASEATVAWIVERAGGNAFYLEELIRAAAETRGEGRAPELPDTVLGLLQARLDAFGEDGKRVLRAASVFGETFWAGGIEALIGGDAELARLDLGRVLAELGERELIEPSPTSRFPGEPELVFRHALVREAAYAMLPERDRAIAHELAGSFLERVGERDSSVLAEHFARGTHPDRAARHFLSAAGEALDGNDFGAAIERADRGIALATERRIEGGLELVRAQALASHGDHAGAQAAALAATELLPHGSTSWYQAMSEHIAACARTGEIDALVRGAGELIDAQAEPDATEAQVVSICRTVIPLTNAVRFDLAERAIERLLRIAPDPDALGPYAAAQIHEARGIMPVMRGSPDSQVTGFELAVERYQAAGALRDLITSLGSLCWAYTYVGDLDRARAAVDRGLALADRIGASHPKTWVEFQYGLLLASSDPGASIPLLERAIEAYRRQSSRRQEGWAHAELGRALLATGDVDRACEVAAQSTELMASAPVFLPRALAIQARALVRLDRFGEAIGCVDRASQMQDALDFRMHEVIVALARVEAFEAAGDRARAQSELESAAAILARRHAALRPEFHNGFVTIPEHAELLARIGRT